MISHRSNSEPGPALRSPAHPLTRGGSRLSDRLARVVAGAGFLVAVAYVGTVVTANWASTHWPALVFGPFVVPAGTLWAGVTFTLRDLLYEILGTPGVVAGVAVGTGVSWLLASPQIAIAIASVVAFIVSETLDSALYAVLRRGSRLRPALVSNLAGLVVDTAVFRAARVRFRHRCARAAGGQDGRDDAHAGGVARRLAELPRGGATMRFYVGAHHPAWLAPDLGVPLLVSLRRLAGRRSLPPRFGFPHSITSAADAA